jgi:hypothetical protein
MTIDVLALLAAVVVSFLVGHVAHRTRQAARAVTQARAVAEADRMRTALLSTPTGDRYVHGCRACRR